MNINLKASVQVKAFVPSGDLYDITRWLFVAQPWSKKKIIVAPPKEIYAFQIPYHECLGMLVVVCSVHSFAGY